MPRVFQRDLATRFSTPTGRVDNHAACHAPLGHVCHATLMRKDSESIHRDYIFEIQCSVLLRSSPFLDLETLFNCIHISCTY